MLLNVARDKLNNGCGFKILELFYKHILQTYFEHIH